MKKFEAYKLAELSALFPPDTAGRDMITRVPIFGKNTLVKEVKNQLLDKAKNYHTINYIYIVNKKSQILGVVSIRELMQAKASEKLANIMVRNIVAVNPMDTVPHVALQALQHNLKMIPIVDHKNRLVGAFSTDQLLEILRKDFSNDLLRLSGIKVPIKHFHFNVSRVIYSRLPWMLIGMIGGLITGSIIGVFKSALESTILLAVFIPVIMSTGATSSNQSAMVFLRNFIHGDIKHWANYIYNEIKISSALALILGAVLFSFLMIFPGDIILAWSVSISLFLTIIIASLIGVITPMVLNKLNFDPSIGAGPFLTIIKDIIAMTIYFSVATLLLTLLR